MWFLKLRKKNRRQVTDLRPHMSFFLNSFSVDKKTRYKTHTLCVCVCVCRHPMTVSRKVMIKHLLCYFNASLATVVTVETPERAPWVWIGHQPGAISVTPSLTRPQQRFCSHFSGCFAWLISVKFVSQLHCWTGPVFRRASFFVRILLCCKCFISSPWHNLKTSLLSRGYNTYDILKVLQLNKWGEVTFEPSLILFIQFAAVRSWRWHARPRRTPPVEHTASRLFAQLGTEDVSGAKQQIPTHAEPPKIDCFHSQVLLIYAKILTFVVLWWWNVAQGRPGSSFYTGGLNQLIILKQSRTIDNYA